MERVPRKFIGGLVKWMTDLFLPKLPKSFRTFLNAHKDELVEKVAVWRTPLDTLSNGVISVLSGGNWEEIKRKASVDKLYHVYMIINDKYILEKTAVPVLKVASATELNRSGAESREVSVPHKITLAQFVSRGAVKMGDKFFSYNAFTNNCQNFLRALLQANFIGGEVLSFVKQDIEALIKETPELTKYLGEQTTDLANAGERIYSEIADKRGGRRIRTDVMMHGRRHHL